MTPKRTLASPKVAVAYLISEYPAVSHTFVLREVRALRASGVQVDTFTIRRTSCELSAVDREEQRSTTSILPAGLVRTLRCHLAALAKSPAAYGATLLFALRRGRQSARRMLWQLFYFNEAMILWHECRGRGLRHVHAHFANAACDIARLTATFGRRSDGDWRWSFTMHGSAEFLDMKGFGLADKVRDADFVVCVSDYCRSQLMWLIDQSSWGKLSVVHCGIDAAAIATTERRHGRAPEELRVLTVGRLIPLKGHATLFEGVALLRSRGVAATVHVVGDGPHRGPLAEIARSIGIDDAISFLGAIGQDEIGAQFEWADVFCLPSMMEGLPVVLMEAMAHGVPVVATAITGVMELIDDGVSGLLVRPGRADLLADALCSLAVDDPLQRRFADAGRRQVEAQFDVKRSAALLADLFRERAAAPAADGRRD